MNKIYTIIFCLFLLISGLNAGAEESALYEKLPDAQRIQEQPQRITNYDYSNATRIPIYLHIENRYKTNGDTNVGDELTFVAARNVYYNGKLLVKRGEKTSAKLTHFIRRGMNGIPSIMILEGFQFENLDSKKLDGKYMKRGFDNTLFVLPLKWVLTPLYPMGSFANIIIGCEARISPKDDIIIYYYPEWTVE